MRYIIFILISFFFVVLSANAAEPPRLYRISCPETWPGPEHEDERLSWITSWSNARAEFSPTPEKIEYTETTLLDCAYGEYGYYSPHRVTLVVPGHIQGCNSPWIGAPPNWCDTIPNTDRTLGPIKLYIARPLNWSTSLLGFTLRRSLTDLLATATINGFACIQFLQDNTAPYMDCKKNDGRIMVFFKNQFSYKIVQYLSKSAYTQNQYLEMMVFRYGLMRYYGWDADAKVPLDIWVDDMWPMAFPHLTLTLGNGTLTLRNFTVDE